MERKQEYLVTPTTGETNLGLTILEIIMCLLEYTLILQNLPSVRVVESYIAKL